MKSVPHVLVGAGGHGRVLLGMLKRAAVEVIGIVDARQDLKGRTIDDIPVIGPDSELENLDRSTVLVNGIGSTGNMQRRQAVFDAASARGFTFATVLHPSAFTEANAILESGVQIFAGAIVQSGCVIGANSILNTGAIIDHDSRIGRHCHVAPGVVLSGGVCVGDGTHLGAGSTVIQGIRIGANCVIGAGSVVIDDVPQGASVVGIPAKAINGKPTAR